MGEIPFGVSSILLIIYGENEMSTLDKHLGPIMFSLLEEQCLDQALAIVMSEIPMTDNVTDLFMDATGDIPERFIVWEPFELARLQELVESFKDSLMDCAQQTLVTCKVIDDE
jgi:hypothetical protein